MPTINEIKNALVEKGSEYAIDMVAEMERRAERYPDYAEALAKWLRDGRTVHLRDLLCVPLKNSDLVRNLKPTVPDPWFNCFAAIDSAWLWAQS